MQYAYASEGYANEGAGFLFSLHVMPFGDYDDYEAFENVPSSSTQYTYEHTFPVGLDDSGIYEFTGKLTSPHFHDTACIHMYMYCYLHVSVCG